jgi:hypothetical protein
MARVLRAKRPFWYPVRVDGYEIRLKIEPGRQAPHVAMDSKRYWEGARSTRVVDALISRAGVTLDPAEYRDLLALACRRANVPPGGRLVRPVFPRQLRLRLSGLLRTAMERTGFQEQEERKDEDKQAG